MLESLRNGSQHDLQPRNLSVSRPPFTLESARISRFLCPSQPSSFPFSLSAQIIDVFSISEFTLLPLELSINGESTKSRRGDLFLLLPQSYKFSYDFLRNSIIGSTIYVVNVGEEGIKNLDFPFTRILVDGFPQIGAGSCDEIFESFLLYFSIATIREEKKKRKIG